MADFPKLKDKELPEQSDKGQATAAAAKATATERQEKHWAEKEQEKIDEAVAELNESGDLEKLGGDLEQPA